MFSLGFALLSVPIFAAFNGDISIYNSIITGTLGITDIVGLLLLKPVKSIHDLMGDMSQIAMAISSYQTQVALRILQFNADDRNTINLAAEEIGKTTKENIELIQIFVEGEYKPKKDKSEEDTPKEGKDNSKNTPEGQNPPKDQNPPGN